MIINAVVEQRISVIYSAFFIADTGTYNAALGPRDCSDVRSMGFTASGVYRVYAGDDRKKMQVDVYCDFNSFKESWLVCILGLKSVANSETRKT